MLAQHLMQRPSLLGKFFLSPHLNSCRENSLYGSEFDIHLRNQLTPALSEFLTNILLNAKIMHPFYMARAS